MKILKDKFVISYTNIPEELTEDHWIADYPPDCYVEAHIDELDDEPLTMWINDNYPNLKDEESFLIHKT